MYSEKKSYSFISVSSQFRLEIVSFDIFKNIVKNYNSEIFLFYL